MIRILGRMSRLSAAAAVLSLVLSNEASWSADAARSSQPSAPRRARHLVSRPAIDTIVRDFRNRIGSDPQIYYLVSPPGGVDPEEEADARRQVVHFLWRLDRDPELDFPSRWIRELKDYELTESEWERVERHFSDALAASSLPESSRKRLMDRLSSLKSQVVVPAPMTQKT